MRSKVFTSLSLAVLGACANPNYSVRPVIDTAELQNCQAGTLESAEGLLCLYVDVKAGCGYLHWYAAGEDPKTVAAACAKEKDAGIQL